MTAVACFATKGSGSNEEARIGLLLAELEPTVLPFDRAHKGRSALRIVRAARRERPQILVLEGTGVAGGAAVLVARRLTGVPYVVSSGDAVAPFVAGRRPWLRPAAALYERLLYRHAAGYIGWTPYLCGRALTLGAPRAMTAANWSLHGAASAREGAAVRDRLGIAADALVFGMVGSLAWNPRYRYCYGLELVRAAARTSREDVVVVVAGGGEGAEHLRREAEGLPRGRVVLAGPVPHEEVPAYLAAFDVASLPQSVDGVGAFRYTTKLSEYLAARCPVVTGEVPFAYDLDEGWLWRLPGDAPWDETYVDALAALMAQITRAEARARAAAARAPGPLFSRERQQRQVAAFIRALTAAGDRARPGP